MIETNIRQELYETHCRLLYIMFHVPVVPFVLLPKPSPLETLVKSGLIQDAGDCIKEVLAWPGIIHGGDPWRYIDREK